MWIHLFKYEALITKYKKASYVIRAAINVKKNHPDWNVVPEIMIPLTGEVKELKYVKNIVAAAQAAIREMH